MDIKLPEWLTEETVGAAVRSALLIFLVLPLVLFLSTRCRKFVGKRFSPQQGLIAGKLIRYGGVIVICLLVMKEFGFSLAPLLGAAGILGVAIAFASQTSVSNIISGLFLIAEAPFRIGDAITVGSVTGVVLSIDTLSIKLRTFDNTYVRIPNETIIKSEVTNLTRFPIRRVDTPVSVAYKEDLRKVREILMDLAKQHPLCLMEPKPLVIFNGYGPSSLDFNYCVWAARDNYLEVKNQLNVELKERFEREGIELPFPHVSLYTGSITEPFPIRMMPGEESTREKAEASGLEPEKDRAAEEEGEIAATEDDPAGRN